MSGVIFKSYDLVKELIENTHTDNGLVVTSSIIKKVYKKGKTACETLYDSGTIIFDKVLGQLNYKVQVLAQ